METWVISQFVSDLAKLGFFKLKINFLLLYRAYPITGVGNFDSIKCQCLSRKTHFPFKKTEKKKGDQCFWNFF